MTSRLRIEGASVEHLAAALDAMMQALGDASAPPRASVLSTPMRQLIDVCVKMTSARHFKSEARNPSNVRAGETHLTPALRRRALQVADHMLVCIVQNYERGSGATAVAEPPVNFQNYCTDERLIGETPTTLLMTVRWHLFFVCYDMHTMSEHDARGETWKSAEARPLGARSLPLIGDAEPLPRARLCATRRTWAEWRQSDVRDIVDVLSRRRAHISSLVLLNAVETALLWVEQRMALFALASHTSLTLDLADNPFERGDRARSRTALSGSAQSPLYGPSREFNAHIAHCLIELYIPVHVSRAFPAARPPPDADSVLLEGASPPHTPLGGAKPPSTPNTNVPQNDHQGDVLLSDAMLHDFVADPVAAMLRNTPDHDPARLFMMDCGGSSSSSSSGGGGGGGGEEGDTDRLTSAGGFQRGAAPLFCGLAQWLETEVKGMLDQRKFRDRVLPTTVHLEFRAGELHDFARHHNGYVMPKRTRAVLQKMRTTAQITDLLETIIKRPIPELMAHTRPTLRTSTMLHAFDVMCDQHTQLQWKAHTCVFESDFFGEYALLYEHATPVLVQYAGCFSVLFRAHFYHCADLVEALATWTHIVVNVLESEFVVGLQRYSLTFLQNWLLQWRRMGRLYLAQNPHQQHTYDAKFEPRLRVAPALRDWFSTHWARMAQQERTEEMMRDMVPGFEPID